MKETQLLKGVLEGCVLQVIAQKEIYGYELVQELKQRGFERSLAAQSILCCRSWKNKNLLPLR